MLFYPQFLFLFFFTLFLYFFFCNVKHGRLSDASPDQATSLTQLKYLMEQASNSHSVCSTVLSKAFIPVFECQKNTLPPEFYQELLHVIMVSVLQDIICEGTAHTFSEWLRVKKK